MRGRTLVCISVIAATAATAAVFAAHAVPLNGKVIEPGIVAGKRWAYPAAVALYFGANLAFIGGSLAMFSAFDDVL